MVTELRPSRGGFLRPIGCAQFIVGFLKGQGPLDSTEIDPKKGACQADIFVEYKEALHRVFAEDMVAYEEQKRKESGNPPYTIEEAEASTAYWMSRIPMKFTRMRYNSFSRYFHTLKSLGWVQPTGEKEVSAAQEPAPGVINPGGQPRIYYRLTATGRKATPDQVSNPQRVVYPHFDAAYFRGKRKAKHYTRAKPH